MADTAVTIPQRTILDALAGGPATLAGLRRAFDADDPHAKALPSMGSRIRSASS